MTHGIRPANYKELFNLRHASLRNVIERIFGVIKRRFKLMSAAAEYNLRTQAKIPCALAALHNYIRIHDPDDDATEDFDFLDDSTTETNPYGNLHQESDDLGGHISNAEKQRASDRRDDIARAMWADYERERELRRSQGML